MDNNGPIPYEMVAMATMSIAPALLRGAGGVWTRTGAGAWSLVLFEGVSQINCVANIQIINAGGGGTTFSTSWVDGDATHKFVNLFANGVAGDVAACVSVFRIL